MKSLREDDDVVHSNAHLSSLVKDSIDMRDQHRLVKRPDFKHFSQIPFMPVVTIKVSGFGGVLVFLVGVFLAWVWHFFVTVLRHIYIVQLVCMRLYWDITPNILQQM